MKIKRIKNQEYLLIKLNKRDSRYLKNIVHYEHPRAVRITDDFFTRVMALHIKSTFVMSAASLLKEERVIKRKEYRLVLKDLNQSLRRYTRIVSKYFKKMGEKLE